MEALIRMTGITRFFGPLCAVSDLNLELFPGEIVGLLGPNGAGKSTTMRILTGCLGASAGSVLLEGVDLRDEPLRAKFSIGYLPETPPLYHDLTVDEYLLFCARLKAVARTEIKAALTRVKSQCGLDQVGKRLIGNLSKGFQQRVGIAQAIIHSPRVIVLDEPTSGLDPNQIIEIRGLIRTLGREHGVLLSSHILPEVQALCDRVVIVHNGRLAYTQQLAAMDQRQYSAVRIRLLLPPAESAITELEAVDQATALGQNSFLLQLNPKCSVEQLAKEIVERDWGLLELMPATQTLEQIFYRLTTTGESSD